MPRLAEIVDFLESFAPSSLAEDWDNVGLLIGNREHDVTAVMTCLTLTPDVAAEAIRERVQLIISHHPVLFRAVQRLTSDVAESQILLQLIEAGIAVHSPHTGYDSAQGGINQQLAEMLNLQNIGVLRPGASADSSTNSIDAGGGRYGTLDKPVTLAQFVKFVSQCLKVAGSHFVGDADRRVQKVAVACGSAAEFMPDAQRGGCDVLVTGEARFHSCLEARTSGIALVLPGHYATERPGVEHLAAVIAAQFPSLRVWPSRNETDPLQWA